MGQGLLQFSGFCEFAEKIIFKKVFGRSSLPIWLPGTIEFIWAGWIPLKPHHKSVPPQTNFFRDHFLGPKNSPGQNGDLGVPKSDPGLQNPSPGMKKQQMRSEKTCRTPQIKRSHIAQVMAKNHLGGYLSKSGHMQGAQELPRRHLRGESGFCIVKIKAICKNSINFFKN